MITEITNKTEALDYLYYVRTEEVHYDDKLHEIAKSYFTEEELKCLDLGPEKHINHCFCGLAKSCGLE